MTDDEILDYCLRKPGAYIDLPFGMTPVCVKVGKRLFAQLYPAEKGRKVTLNCDMMTGDFYRNQYPGTVVRGYHCPPVQQPYFNTVMLDGTVNDSELKEMIDHSYMTVVKKLTQKQQKELHWKV